MKKLLVFFAIITYTGVAVYSLTKIKNPALVPAQAKTEDLADAKNYKLYSAQADKLSQFYREAFGTAWQHEESGYQGQVLDATVQIVSAKKRTRRVTLQVFATDTNDVISNVVAAGGTIKIKTGTAGKNYLITDPDGNTVLLSSRNE